MISPSVAPFARAIMSRIFAPLLSARGAAAFLAAVGFTALLLAPAPASAAVFRAALALAPCLGPGNQSLSENGPDGMPIELGERV
jgi:hypothetical protein